MEDQAKYEVEVEKAITIEYFAYLKQNKEIVNCKKYEIIGNVLHVDDNSFYPLCNVQYFNVSPVIKSDSKIGGRI